MSNVQCQMSNVQDLTDQEQAEIIADRFSAVSNEYNPIDTGKRNIPQGQEDSVLIFSPLEVLTQLLELKARKSTAPIDIPAIIIKGTVTPKSCYP